MTGSALHPPGWRDCWRAARNVRTADRGREVLRWLRPRDAFWPVVRSRAPLTVLLYIAACEQRLLWRSPDGFAVLEHPGSVLRESAESPAMARVLRWLDKAWQALHFLGAVCAVSIAMAIVGRSAASPGMVSAAIVLLAVVAVMVAVMLFGVFRDVVRDAMPRPAVLRARLLTGDLRTRYWSLMLCHLADPSGIEGLLDDLTTRPRWADGVVVLEAGVTTRAGRATLARSRLVRQRFEEPGALVIARGPVKPVAVPSVPESWYRSGRVFSLTTVLAGLAAYLFGFAFVVSDLERSGCSGAGCDGRPATYGDALYWLFNRLGAGDPEGIGASTASGRAIAVLTTMVGWVVLGAVVDFFAARARQGWEIPVAELAALDRPAEKPASRPVDAPTAPSRIPTKPPGIVLAAAVAVGVAVGAVVARQRAKGRRRP